MKKTFSIGRLAHIAGVTVQTLRYYETRGLLSPLARDASGYRIYNEEACKRLYFIGWAKGLGFTLEEIKEILNLQGKGSLTCEWMRERASEKLTVAEEKVKGLTSVVGGLKKIMSFCESHTLTDECPILKDLEYPAPWNFEGEQERKRKSSSQKPSASDLLARRRV